MIAPRLGDRPEPTAESIAIDHDDLRGHRTTRPIALIGIPLRGEAGVIERLLELDAHPDVSHRDQNVHAFIVSSAEKLDDVRAELVDGCACGSHDPSQREKPVDQRGVAVMSHGDAGGVKALRPAIAFVDERVESSRDHDRRRTP